MTKKLVVNQQVVLHAIYTTQWIQIYPIKLNQLLLIQICHTIYGKLTDSVISDGTQKIGNTLFVIHFYDRELSIQNVYFRRHSQQIRTVDCR